MADIGDTFELSLSPTPHPDVCRNLRKKIPRLRALSDEDIGQYILLSDHIDRHLASTSHIEGFIRSLAKGRLFSDNKAKRNAVMLKFKDNTALLTWLTTKEGGPICCSLTWPEFTALGIDMHKHKRFVSQAKGDPSIMAAIIYTEEGDVHSITLFKPM